MLFLLLRACVALLLCGSVVSAQTLAHPGWRGNGITSEAWWKHAALVRFDGDTTFVKAAESMDAMSQAGADSLILPDLLPIGSAQVDAGGATHPFAEKFGTEDELDALLREASARRMHVLLRVDLLRLAGSPGELRFWMSRGIAGFDVGDVSPAQMDTLQLLRGAMDRVAGRRILLAHTSDSGLTARRRQDPVTLHLLSPSKTALARASVAGNAVEVDSADMLKTPLPPNTTIVVTAGLLQSEAARDDLRHAVAARGTHGQTYSGGRSTRRRWR